jgi:hypothetical protein
MNKCLFFSVAISFLLLNMENGFSQQNVGVGTTTPAYRLDVQGDPTDNAIVNINSKVNYAGSLDIKAIQGYSNPALGFGIGGSFTGGFKGIDAFCPGGSYSGPLYGVYSNATGTAGTRIGILGTASGGAINYGVWGNVNGGANNYGIYGQNTNLSGYAGYFDGRGLFLHELRTNDNLLVDDNEGIGTTTPNTKLQILNGSDCSLTTNGFIQLGASNSWNLIMDDNEILARNNGVGNDFFIQNDGGNVLMCASKLGGVGIGITAGSSLANGYILSVDGKIIAEEMRIQNSTNWPDYVFAEQYHLMPLDELKKSIEKNKHLPNIPSASTVEHDGILVGDMQKHMMEKIEELTLYILDLNTLIKKQQSEIDQLKTSVEALKEK